MVNRASGKALDVNGAGAADGAQVIQWSSTGSLNQQWRFLPNSAGSFRLVARHSGRLLNQWWRLVDAGGGHYRMTWTADVKALTQKGKSQ